MYKSYLGSFLPRPFSPQTFNRPLCVCSISHFCHCHRASRGHQKTWAPFCVGYLGLGWSLLLPASLGITPLSSGPFHKCVHSGPLPDSLWLRLYSFLWSPCSPGKERKYLMFPVCCLDPYTWGLESERAGFTNWDTGQLLDLSKSQILI